MVAPPPHGGEHHGVVREEPIEVDVPARRLKAAAVLLVAVAVLGFLAAGASYTGYSGMEGLGDLLKEPRADVMGMVKDADGDPVANATVTVNGTGATSTTGGSGYYFLKDVPTGRVHIRAEAAGYETVVRDVTLERGTYTVDIVTSPGAGTVEVAGEAAPSAGNPGSGAAVALAGMCAASVAALLGAYDAFTRRYYVVAFAGALLALFAWGWWLGSLLALAAVLLVLPARAEFRGKREKRPFPWDREEPPEVRPEERPRDDARDVGAPGGPDRPGGGRA